MAVNLDKPVARQQGPEQAAEQTPANEGQVAQTTTGEAAAAAQAQPSPPADGVDDQQTRTGDASPESQVERATQGIAAGTTATQEAAAKTTLVRDFSQDLTARAKDPEAFHAAMGEIFGAPTDPAEARTQRDNFEALRQRALAGDTSWLPAAVRFVDPATLGEGVGAAYSPRDGGTVLLSRDLLNNPEQLRAAFSEEVGHHLDTLRQLDPAELQSFMTARRAGQRPAVQLTDRRDAVGDEGARFSGFVQTGQVPENTGMEGRGYVDGVGEVEHHTVTDNEVRSVRFDRPTSVGMHESWSRTSLAPAISDGQLDLNAVTPEMLNGLSADNMRTFFGILDGIEARSTTTSGAGRVRSGTVNAATLMAARVWGSGDSEAFARVFAAAPNRILPFLTGNGSRVLSAENLALIMREMRTSGTEYTTSELDALGSLVQTYLERNVGNDPERVGGAMRSLMTEINRSGLEFNAENAGVVGGAVVSGMLRHFDEIRASDEQRARIIGNVLNTTATAAGGFGPWGAVVGTALHALNTVYQEVDRPRDYAEHASRFQSALQLRWLQHRPTGWSRDDVQDAILWMDTTIKANGQR